MENSSRKLLELQLTVVDVLTIQAKKLNLFITSISLQSCSEVAHGFATQMVVYNWIFCKP